MKFTAPTDNYAALASSFWLRYTYTTVLKQYCPLIPIAHVQNTLQCSGATRMMNSLLKKKIARTISSL